MLSILIPTYNYVCVKLVTDLQQQAERLECPYEILVADDASEDAFKRENRKINGIPNCKYIELQENVGRSRIRNILGCLARYDYLIFMDCDASVVSNEFLSRYMAVRNAAEVVYGGLRIRNSFRHRRFWRFSTKNTPSLTSRQKNGLYTPTKSSARLIS